MQHALPLPSLDVHIVTLTTLVCYTPPHNIPSPPSQLPIYIIFALMCICTFALICICILFLFVFLFVFLSVFVSQHKISISIFGTKTHFWYKNAIFVNDPVSIPSFDNFCANFSLTKDEDSTHCHQRSALLVKFQKDGCQANFLIWLEN